VVGVDEVGGGDDVSRCVLSFWLASETNDMPAVGPSPAIRFALPGPARAAREGSSDHCCDGNTSPAL